LTHVYVRRVCGVLGISDVFFARGNYTCFDNFLAIRDV
jgi:hypothetical protein